MCAIVTPEYMQYGSVGVPVPSIEIKLVDVPDAGYFGTNSPPQGEIYIRGPSVTKGYFKREDLTKEAITADGWLMTGDVGQWNTDGTLSVIDRKKNLVKLQGGEVRVVLSFGAGLRLLLTRSGYVCGLLCIYARISTSPSSV